MCHQLLTFAQFGWEMFSFILFLLFKKWTCFSCNGFPRNLPVFKLSSNFWLEGPICVEGLRRSFVISRYWLMPNSNGDLEFLDIPALHEDLVHVEQLGRGERRLISVNFDTLRQMTSSLETYLTSRDQHLRQFKKSGKQTTYIWAFVILTLKWNNV